jgi:hypothetical protein
VYFRCKDSKEIESSLGRHSEDNINMNPKEIRCEDVGWIQLAQDGV